MSLASGAADSGSRLALEDCTEALEAGDGRSVFELTAAGQLKFPHMGNYCVVVAPSGLVSVQDCSVAEDSAGGQDKFFATAVSELDPTRAAAAADMAALLSAATARQAALVAKLREALPVLEECKLALSTHSSHVRPNLALGQVGGKAAQASEGDAAARAIGEMYASLGVDMDSIKSLIDDSARALSVASSKAAASKAPRAE